MKKVIVTLVLVTTWSLQATTYYVDPGSGNDANAGTSTGSAWAHLPDAVSGGPTSVTLANGDKVIVKGGSVNNYQVKFGTHYTANSAYDNIVIQSGHLFSPQWGTTNAQFDQQNTRLYGIAINKSGITIDGLEIYNVKAGTSGDGNGDGSAGVEIWNCNFVSVKRCKIHDCFRSANDQGHGIEFGGGVHDFLIYLNKIGPGIGTKGTEMFGSYKGAVTNNLYYGTSGGDHSIAMNQTTNVDVAYNTVNRFGTPVETAYAVSIATSISNDFWGNVLVGGAAGADIGGFVTYTSAGGGGYPSMTNRFAYNTIAFFQGPTGADHDVGAIVLQYGYSGVEKGMDMQNNLLYKCRPNSGSIGNIGYTLAATLVDGEVFTYNDVFFNNGTEKVMNSYNAGDHTYTVAAFTKGTGTGTYANNQQLDPAFLGGTLPTDIDANGAPNTLYFSLTASTPLIIGNTGNHVQGSALYGYRHDAGKYDYDILGKPRTVYSMGAYELPTDPTVTVQPTAQSVTAGSQATFTLTATGTAPLTYQWFTNGVSMGAAGQAATMNITPPDTSWDGTSIRCNVTSAAGGPLSSVTVALSVTSGSTAPTITTQPQNVTTTVGTAATWTVAASGTAPFTYAWTLNGSSVGSNSSSYTLSNPQLSDSGKLVQVNVSNSAGNVNSSTATLTVNQTPAAANLTIGTMNVGRMHIGP